VGVIAGSREVRVARSKLVTGENNDDDNNNNNK
jgi:hypothetical protein